MRTLPVLDALEQPDAWLADGGFDVAERAFLRRVIDHVRALGNWREQQRQVTPEVSVVPLTAREGWAILMVPPNGDQPDRFEYWVDEPYVTQERRQTRPQVLRAEVEQSAAILRAQYQAVIDAPPPPSLLPPLPDAPTERAAGVRDALLAAWRQH
jgi:hypothetical protein